MANNSNNASNYLNPASQVMIQQIEEANHNAERQLHRLCEIFLDELKPTDRGGKISNYECGIFCDMY